MGKLQLFHSFRKPLSSRDSYEVNEISSGDYIDYLCCLKLYLRCLEHL